MLKAVRNDQLVQRSHQIPNASRVYTEVIASNTTRAAEMNQRTFTRFLHVHVQIVLEDDDRVHGSQSLVGDFLGRDGIK